MCFSESVSWATLVASILGNAVLSTSGPEWAAVSALLLTAGSMQAYEALLWRRSTSCDRDNARISTMGALTNHAEPLVYWLACMTLLARTGGSWIADAIAVAYTVMFAAAIVSFADRPIERKCTLDRGHGLVWTWNEHGRYTTWIYGTFLASMIATTYGYIPSPTAHLVAGTFLTSFVTSYVVYGRRGMVGSMWCFFAALAPWILWIFAA